MKKHYRQQARNVKRKRTLVRLFMRSIPYSTLSCLSAADRRSEFLASSRFWLLFAASKSDKEYNKKEITCSQKLKINNQI